MALADVFNDPQKLQKLSTFLLNFGQGLTLANERGLSPFASLAVGFGQGGNSLQALQQQAAEEEFRKRKQELEEERLDVSKESLELRRQKLNHPQPKARTMTPEEVAATGFPKGSIVQRMPDNTLRVVHKPPTNSTVRVRKIADTSARLQETRGMSPAEANAEAQQIVDGLIEYEIVEGTGEVRRINKVTGEVSAIPLSGQDQPEPELTGPTIVEMVRDRDVTGLSGALTEAGAATIGQFVEFGPESQETIAFRQAIRTKQQDLVRSLAINPRFPVSEQERIRQEINLSPSAFDSREAFLSRAQGVARSLADRLRSAEADAANPNLPEDTRSAQAQNAAAIRTFMRSLGADDNGNIIGTEETEDPDIDALVEKYLGP